MAALSVQVPYPVFYDRDGQPLDNGRIYIGDANQDPITNPLATYYDEALTIPASQPLITSGGYIYRNGTPAQIYVDAINFSILVNDNKDLLVYSFPDGTGLQANASLIDYDPPFVGAVTSGYTIADKLSQTVSVQDFGAVGDGVTDDTAAIQAAVDAITTGTVHFPAGTYKVTATIDITKNGIHLLGDGSWATEIHMTADDPAIAIAGSSVNVINGSSVRNMTVRGSGQSNTSAHGISYAWANTCYIEDVVLFSCRHALHFEHNWQTALNNIRIYGAGGDQSYIGVYMAETTALNVDNAINANNVYAQQTSGYGFRIINGQGSKFVNCEAGGSPMIHAWYIGDPTTGTVNCEWINFVNCLGDSTISACWLFRKGTATKLQTMNISNCWAGNGEYGMYFDGAENITVTAALIIGNTKHGMVFNQSNRIVTTNCILRDNNEASDPTYADLALQNSIYCLFQGNMCDSATGVGLSIRETASSYGNMFYGNQLLNGSCTFTGNSWTFFNSGFRTEQRGVATITAGGTSVTVTHGLNLTPPISAISVTPNSDPGAATKFWVTDVTSTTFKININAVSASNADFAWNIVLSTLL